MLAVVYCQLCAIWPVLPGPCYQFCTDRSLLPVPCYVPVLCYNIWHQSTSLHLNLNTIMSFFFLVIRCPVFNAWDDVIVNSTDNHYRSAVNYTCVDGMVIALNKTSAEVTCDITGEWKPSVKTCRSKETHRLIIQLKYTPTHIYTHTP